MSDSSVSKQPPWTIGRLIEWTHKHFEVKGVDAPRLAAELLLAHALNCRKIELYTRFAEVPAAPQLSTFREAVKAAATGAPVAYLLGTKEFYGISFDVTDSTLIPRPETETLVDQTLAWCRAQQPTQAKIWDLGTGSGCVGLALCAHLSDATVLGSDVSAAALQIAQRNAERLTFQDRFSTVEADCANLPGEVVPADGFDVLVSNPPYVADDDPQVQPNVKAHEPHVALFAGPDGLACYRLLAEGAAPLVRPGGAVFLEIGHNQHDAVVEIVTAQPQFEYVESFRDHIEEHLRVVAFRRID